MDDDNGQAWAHQLELERQEREMSGKTWLEEWLNEMPSPEDSRNELIEDQIARELMSEEEAPPDEDE